jgi:hypothetical protein
MKKDKTLKPVHQRMQQVKDGEFFMLIKSKPIELRDSTKSMA